MADPRSGILGQQAKIAFPGEYDHLDDVDLGDRIMGNPIAMVKFQEAMKRKEAEAQAKENEPGFLSKAMEQISPITNLPGVASDLALTGGQNLTLDENAPLLSGGYRLNKDIGHQAQELVQRAAAAAGSGDVGQLNTWANEPIAGEEAHVKKAFVEQHPVAAFSEAVAKPLLRGGVQLVTDPLLKGMGKAGEIAARGATAGGLLKAGAAATPEAAAALKGLATTGRIAGVAEKGLGAAFLPGMIEGMAENAVNSREKFAEGDWVGGVEDLTQAGIDTTFVGMGLRPSVKGVMDRYEARSKPVASQGTTDPALTGMRVETAGTPPPTVESAARAKMGKNAGRVLGYAGAHLALPGFAGWALAPAAANMAGKMGERLGLKQADPLHPFQKPIGEAELDTAFNPQQIDQLPNVGTPAERPVGMDGAGEFGRPLNEFEVEQANENVNAGIAATQEAQRVAAEQAAAEAEAAAAPPDPIVEAKKEHQRIVLENRMRAERLKARELAAKEAEVDRVEALRAEHPQLPDLVASLTPPKGPLTYEKALAQARKSLGVAEPAAQTAAEPNLTAEEAVAQISALDPFQTAENIPAGEVAGRLPAEVPPPVEPARRGFQFTPEDQAQLLSMLAPEVRGVQPGAPEGLAGRIAEADPFQSVESTPAGEANRVMKEAGVPEPEVSKLEQKARDLGITREETDNHPTYEATVKEWEDGKLTTRKKGADGKVGDVPIPYSEQGSRQMRAIARGRAIDSIVAEREAAKQGKQAGAIKGEGTAGTPQDVMDQIVTEMNGNVGAIRARLTKNGLDAEAFEPILQEALARRKGKKAEGVTQAANQAEVDSTHEAMLADDLVAKYGKNVGALRAAGRKAGLSAQTIDAALARAKGAPVEAAPAQPTDIEGRLATTEGSQDVTGIPPAEGDQSRGLKGLPEDVLRKLRGEIETVIEKETDPVDAAKLQGDLEAIDEALKTAPKAAPKKAEKAAKKTAPKAAEAAPVAPEAPPAKAEAPEAAQPETKAPRGARTPEEISRLKALLDEGNYQEAAKLARETTSTPTDRKTSDGWKVGYVDSTGAMIVGIDSDGMVSKLKPTPKKANEVSFRPGVQKQYSAESEPKSLWDYAVLKAEKSGLKVKKTSGAALGTDGIRVTLTDPQTGKTFTGTVSNRGAAVAEANVLTKRALADRAGIEVSEYTGEPTKKSEYSLEDDFGRYGVKGPKAADRELLKLATSGQEKDVAPAEPKGKLTPPDKGTKRPFAEDWLDVEDLKKHQPKSQAERQYSLDKLGFFSQAEKALEKAPNKQNGDQWLSFLSNPQRGVKTEELRWTGLGDYLKERSGKSVTSEEIANYLKANKVQIVEIGRNIELPDINVIDESSTMTRVFAQKASGGILSSIVHKPHDKPGWVFERPDSRREYQFDTKAEAVDAAKLAFENLLKSDPALGSRAPHAAYQSEGKKSNYRAIRLTVPQTREGANSFVKESHYKEPGVVVSFRVNDRKSSDGKKTLFVEEIQSDAGSAAKEGFGDPRQVEQLRAVNQDIEDFAASMRQQYGEEKGRRRDSWSKSEQSEHALLLEKLNKLRDGGPPPAPFIGDTKGYTELAVKRLMRIAAEEGYDKVAWTRGATQAKRWQLTNEVDEVVYNPATKKLMAFKDGDSKASETVEPQNLGKYLGEEMAKKLLSQPDAAYTIEKSPDIHGVPVSRAWKVKNADGVMVGSWDTEASAKIQARELGGGRKRLRGEALEVGNRWAHDYYDKVIPSAFEKVGKRVGAKVGKSEIEFENPYEVIESPHGYWVADGIGNPVKHVMYASTEAPKGALSGFGRDDRTYFDTKANATAYAKEMDKDIGFTEESNRVQSVDITPEVRKSIMGEGFSQYQVEKTGLEGREKAGKLPSGFDVYEGAGNKLKLAGPNGETVSVRLANDGKTIEMWRLEKADADNSATMMRAMRELADAHGSDDIVFMASKNVEGVSVSKAGREMMDRLAKRGEGKWLEDGNFKLNNAAPPGASEPMRISLKSVKKLLPPKLAAGMYKDAESGAYVIDTPRGTIRIVPKERIEIDYSVLEKGYTPEEVAAAKAGTLGIAGESTTIAGDALINIVKKGALPHEIMHVFLNHFATAKERAILEKKLGAQLEKQGKKVTQEAKEELIANTFRDYFNKKAADPGWQPKGPVGRFMKDIYDFFQGAYRLVRPNAESVMEGVRTGESFYDRTKGAKRDTGMTSPTEGWPVGRGERPNPTRYLGEGPKPIRSATGSMLARADNVKNRRQGVKGVLETQRTDLTPRLVKTVKPAFEAAGVDTSGLPPSKKALTAKMTAPLPKYSLGTYEGDPYRALKSGRSDYIKQAKAVGMAPAEVKKGLEAADRAALLSRAKPNMMPKDALYDAAGNKLHAVRPNRDFGTTLDLDTNCPRAVNANALTDAIQKAGGFIFNGDDKVALQLMLKQRDMTPECTYCYTFEGRRKASDFSARATTEGFTLRKGKPTEERWGPLDPKYLIDAEAARNASPEIKAHIAAARSYIGAANANKVKPFTPYQGEFLKQSKEAIAKENSLWGMRLNSNTDFKPYHALDTIQAVNDGSVMGKKAHVYTKEIDLLLGFGDTNIKFNLSLAGEGDGKGGIRFDARQGMDPELVKWAYKRYKNAGGMLVALNTDAVIAAMRPENTFIGQVIPGHIGLRKGELEALGWENQSGQQHERPLTKGELKPGQQPGDGEPIHRDVHKDDLETFLSVAEKRGLRPRFSEYIYELNKDGHIVRGGDGSPLRRWTGLAGLKNTSEVMQKAGVKGWDDPKAVQAYGKQMEQGYMKMVRDFARVDTPFEAMKPNYNMKHIDQTFKDWLDEGVGAEDTPVDSAIVDEFLALRAKGALPKLDKPNSWEMRKPLPRAKRVDQTIKDVSGEAVGQYSEEGIKKEYSAEEAEKPYTPKGKRSLEETAGNTATPRKEESAAAKAWTGQVRDSETGELLPNQTDIMAGKTVFEWGAGQGADVGYYKRRGLKTEGYDPNWENFAKKPAGTADIVTSTYVGNVLTPEARNAHWQDAYSRAKDKLLVTVRNSVPAGIRKEQDGVIVRLKGEENFQRAWKQGDLLTDLRKLFPDATVTAGPKVSSGVTAIVQKKGGTVPKAR